MLDLLLFRTTKGQQDIPDKRHYLHAMLEFKLTNGLCLLLLEKEASALQNIRILANMTT